MTLDRPYLWAEIGPAPPCQPRSRLPLLQVSNGNIHRQGSAIKHQSKHPGRDPYLGFSSFVCQGLGYLGLFASPLVLSLHGEGALPPFYYFGTSLIPLSFEIHRIRSGWQRGWRRWELGLTGFLGRLVPGLRFHNVKKTSHQLALYPHGFRDERVCLSLAYFCYG